MRQLIALLALAFAATAPAVIKVACLGDSITLGYGIAKPEMSYPSLLQKTLGAGYEVRNFGVTGSTVTDPHPRSYRATAEYRAAEAFRPDVVILMMGTNDAWPSIWDKSGPQFAARYREIVQHWQKKAKRVILCVPPLYTPIGGQRDNLDLRISPIVREVAREQRLELVDFTKKRLAYCPDGVHPNEQGARLMADTLHSAVAQRRSR